MKKVLFMLCLGFFCISCSEKLVGGEDDATVLLPEEDTVIFKPYEIKEATGVSLHCIGAEFDPHLYAQNFLGKKDESKVEDWQIVEDRVGRMKLHRFRVMLQPQWYEPYNDNDDPQNTDMSAFKWNTTEMQSLYYVLDLAQKNNIDVCLVVWGCTTYVSMFDPEYSDVTTTFNCDRVSDNWQNPPKNPEEFAENFAAVTKYLIEEKGYTCIKEVTPFNEPDGNVCEINRYIQVCKAMDRQFTRLGVRDKVGFCLSDNTDGRRFFLERCAASLKGEADSFNSHTYIFGYETPNSVVQEWERANVEVSNRAGKTHMVGEFGSNQCVGATRQKDIDFYLRGVLMTRHVINFLQAGATGVSYWSLVDQYYGRNEGLSQMQQLGLWRYVKSHYRKDGNGNKIEGNYTTRYQYYSYAMLSESLQRGAEMRPIELNRDFANAMAFKNPDGKWVYVIANQEKDDLGIILNNPETDGASFEILRYKEDEIPEDDSLIKPYLTKKAVDGKLKIAAFAETVVVARQI